MKLCSSCIGHIYQAFDEIQGKRVKLAAYNCKKPIHENGRVYGCYYFFFKDCIKDYDQPERSKREDSQKCEMRCSEHCGNTMKDK